MEKIDKMLSTVPHMVYLLYPIWYTYRTPYGIPTIPHMAYGIPTVPHMVYLPFKSLTIRLSNFEQPMPLYWYNFCLLLTME